MICLGLPMFTSCEEDEKEWELTELELAPTESFDIQYKGGSQSFSFKTNTNWKILSSGDWISFDKTSGTGDATVIATFAENSSNDNRKAVIRIQVKNLHLITMLESKKKRFLHCSIHIIKIE